jgi:hypothetical protein
MLGCLRAAMFATCVVLAATVAVDSWIRGDDDWALAVAVTPGTPEIVERTHRQQPEMDLADRPERDTLVHPPAERRDVARRPAIPRAIRLPEGLTRCIARQHRRAPTEKSPA